MCVAALDIDSDSYLIFPIGIEDFEKIRRLAELIGEGVELANRM